MNWKKSSDKFYLYRRSLNWIKYFCVSFCSDNFVMEPKKFYDSCAAQCVFELTPIFRVFIKPELSTIMLSKCLHYTPGPHFQTNIEKVEWGPLEVCILGGMTVTVFFVVALLERNLEVTANRTVVFIIQNFEACVSLRDGLAFALE